MELLCCRDDKGEYSPTAIKDAQADVDQALTLTGTAHVEFRVQYPVAIFAHSFPGAIASVCSAAQWDTPVPSCRPMRRSCSRFWSRCIYCATSYIARMCIFFRTWLLKCFERFVHWS
jgi:hypothetical protein